MRAKNISTQSNNILTFFNKLDQDCFAYAEAVSALPNSSNSALKELLSDMVKRGLLMRLKKGLYYMIPYEKEAEFFMPDWHIVAGHLTKGENHYIGYYSALQIHNVITQPSLKEQIVVQKQIRPSIITIKNVDFQFIYHNENHFFGANTVLLSFLFNQAPHQEKLLLAVILFLHKLIKYMSSCGMVLISI